MLSLQVLCVFVMGTLGPPVCPPGCAVMCPPVCAAVCAADGSVITAGDPVVLTVCQTGDPTTGDPTTVGMNIVTCLDASGDNALRWVALRPIDGDEDDPAGAGLKRLVLERTGDFDIEAGGPWLGIRFGPVPKALASHLPLDAGSGQMVANVVEGSPADDAGFERYDVIVKIDGEPVPSDTGEFLETIGGLEPGETYAFTLLRRGERMQASVTVGTRPEDVGTSGYKYETDLEELSQGRILRRGGLLEKDEDGNWTFKRFPFKNLPDVWKVFPEAGDFEFDFDFGGSGGFPDAQHNVFIWKGGKAQTLRIEKNGDGEITVTRTETDDDGNETTTTKAYADEKELEQGDPDAYEMLNKSPTCGLSLVGKKGAKLFMAPGLGKGHGIFRFAPGDFEIDLDVEDVIEGAQEARKHAEGLRKKLKKQLGELGADGRHGLGKAFSHRKPRTSFERLEDGKIRVTRRKGDEELVETFGSAEALKTKRPELFKKFKRLQGTREKKTPKR